MKCGFPLEPERADLNVRTFDSESDKSPKEWQMRRVVTSTKPRRSEQEGPLGIQPWSSRWGDRDPKAVRTCPPQESPAAQAPAITPREASLTLEMLNFSFTWMFPGSVGTGLALTTRQEVSSKSGAPRLGMALALEPQSGDRYTPCLRQLQTGRGRGLPFVGDLGVCPA